MADLVRDGRAAFAEITEEGLRALELATHSNLGTLRSVLFTVTDSQRTVWLDAA